MRPAVAFALALTALSARAQQPPQPRKHAPGPTSPAITPADAMTRLYVIADDSMLGRDAGTIGNFKATTYIANEVKRLGLEPAGEGGSYFQTVPLLNVRLDPGSHVVADRTPLEFVRDVTAPIPDLRWRVRPFDNATAIYGGKLGDTSSYITPALAAGKVVVVRLDTNARGQAVTPALYALRRPGGRYFDAAAVVGVSPFPQGLRMFTAAFMDRWATAFYSAEPPDTAHVAPVLVMTRGSAQRLFSSPLESLRPGTTGNALHGNLAYSVRDTAPARNVIAVLRGGDPALRGEYVAIGAHSDHVGTRNVLLDHDSVRVFNRMFRTLGARDEPPMLDAGQAARLRAALDSVRRLRPARLDSIYNGADDDGSGTAALLEIAEAFATTRVRPRRSILFVWHTAEEGNLNGSRWFTSHPTVPIDSIVAQLQMDHVSRGRAEDTPGGGPRYVAIVTPRDGRPTFADAIDSANAAATWGFDIDWSRGRADAVGGSVACGSDHAAYDRFGVPTAFFFTGFHVDYHQVTDEPQYSDYDKLAHVAQFVHDVALRIANANTPPPRVSLIPGGRTACVP
ncbi:MAG TPA: M20/M25/M40 family metallo-hydrolase [Gemmatimonadaceae bacterium]|nr:M20/M25/M40 family metallo-hydrolase [Gemmatimonadaceae bacterium]